MILTIVTIVGIGIFINKPYANTKEYLKKNNTNINIKDEDDFSGLDILSKDLKNKKIILAGEEHSLNKNQMVQLKFLKYLQKEIGVNYILAEIGYAEAHFLNKYLESGDESILKYFFDSRFFNSRSCTKENYDSYKNLYKFNQELPQDKRIKIIGTDVESLATYDYIIDVLKNKNIQTKELNDLLDKLKDFNYRGMYSNNYKDLLNIVEKLNKHIEANEKIYKDIFVDDFEGFKHVTKNLENLCKLILSDKKDSYSIRDSYSYENFKVLDSKLDNPVYFGQWGSSHIFQDIVYDNTTLKDTEYFASLLNKDEKYKGKVLSIHYGYYSKDITPHQSRCYVDTDLFEDYLESEDEAILFKLNGRKSPFSKEPINLFSNNKFDFKGNPTTNYFQYLILIKNSTASNVL